MIPLLLAGAVADADDRTQREEQGMNARLTVSMALMLVVAFAVAAADPPKKTGAVVYEAYPKDIRDQLVKDWEEAVQAALKATEKDPRGRRPTNASETE